MMWTYAESFGSGPNTTYLLFDAVRGWHMHNYPNHWEEDGDRDCEDDAVTVSWVEVERNGARVWEPASIGFSDTDMLGEEQL